MLPRILRAQYFLPTVGAFLDSMRCALCAMLCVFCAVLDALCLMRFAVCAVVCGLCSMCSVLCSLLPVLYMLCAARCAVLCVLCSELLRCVSFVLCCAVREGHSNRHSNAVTSSQQSTQLCSSQRPAVDTAMQQPTASSRHSYAATNSHAVAHA